MAFDRDTIEALAWLRQGWDGDNSERAIAAFATLDNAEVFRALDEQTGYAAPEEIPGTWCGGYDSSGDRCGRSMHHKGDCAH
jgi:hypothetical protein